MSSQFPPGNGQFRPSSPGGQGQPPAGVWGVLHVVGGNDRGKQYPLQLVQTNIGRGADQDLILADIAVSRRHVQIFIEGPRYRVKDLGSGNGTLINGVRSDTVLLNDGDQIEIGNTVMRLEHPPSRAQQAAPPPMSLSMPQAASDNKTMMGDAVSFPLPPAPGAGPPPMMGHSGPMGQGPSLGAPSMPPTPLPPMPSFAPPPNATMAMDAPLAPPPNAYRPQSQSLPVPINTGSHETPGGGLLDSPAKKIAVFGALGLVVLLAGAVIVKKFVLGGNDAEKLFAEGKAAYDQQDYPTAKRLFSSAFAANPEMAQAQKFMKQCDAETFAHNTLKKANGLQAKKQWVEELKQLDKIDKSTQAYKEAEDLRKTAVPAAVEDYIKEAKDVMKDSPDEAKQKVAAALELDPENDEVLKLDEQLKKGGAVASADEPDKGKKGKKDHFALVADETPTPVHKVAAAQPVTAVKSKHASNDDDDISNPIKRPAASSSDAGGGDVLSGPASAAYKSKDFNGAANTLRGVKTPASQALANQMMSLAQAYTKAEADKVKNLAAAATEYQQAMAIDAKVGKSFHASYLKGQLGKTEKALAQQAFQQGKYDQAFEASKGCAKAGSDDGGVGNQLKARAVQLLGQAEGMKKGNPNGAKGLWRMIVTMVPPSDPSFAKAQAGLKSSSGPAAAHDEDE